MLSSPWVLKMMRCPVTGFLSVVHSAGRLREHFMYRQFFSRIVVVQEGKEPLPRCDLCNMHMSVGRLIKHHNMKQCDSTTHMWWPRRDITITSQCAEASFSLMGEDGA